MSKKHKKQNPVDLIKQQELEQYEKEAEIEINKTIDVLYTDEYWNNKKIEIRNKMNTIICDWLITDNLYTHEFSYNTFEYDKSGELHDFTILDYPDPKDNMYEVLDNIYTGTKTPTYMSGMGWTYENILDNIDDTLDTTDNYIITEGLKKYECYVDKLGKDRLTDIIIAATDKYYNDEFSIMCDCITSLENITVSEFCEKDVKLTEFLHDCYYKIELEKTTNNLILDINKITGRKKVSISSLFSNSSFDVDETGVHCAQTDDDVGDVYKKYLLLTIYSAGGIIIREFLDEKYEGKNAKGEKMMFPYKNLYGCRGFDGTYSWISVDDLFSVCNTSCETNELIPPEIGVNYCYYPDKFNK